MPKVSKPKDRVNHEKFMRMALSLALKAKGRTLPNPLVGAVVVKKGKVVGRGYHARAGLAHAEVVALEKAGKAARGSRLYVNLEPCCHIGKTGPCVERIKASGVKEVIFAMLDPNPLNNGKGAQFLRRNGIKAISGVLEKEAKRVNRIFVKNIIHQLPFVTVKVAQSLDGKIATASGDSRWISSESSRKYVHKLRSMVDAILVGINTVLKDNPLLSCRLNGRVHKRQPKKIVVDSNLRLTPQLKIFSRRSPAEVIIATTRFAPQDKLSYFRKKAQVIVARDRERRVDLLDLLKKLAKQGFAHILIEGGGRIIAAALKQRLVDEMIVFVSPRIIGGEDAPTAVEGEGVRRISQAQRLEDVRFKKLGSDFIIEGQVSPD